MGRRYSLSSERKCPQPSPLSRCLERSIALDEWLLVEMEFIQL
jgi:hypothetical protein